MTDIVILFVIAILSIFTLIVSVISLLKHKDTSREADDLKKELRNVSSSQDRLGEAFTLRTESIEKQINNNNTQTEQKLDNMRRTINESLDSIRRSNTEQLTNIKQTVDEKLQDTLDKKLSDSFKIVSERLEQVYKGLGEMQTIANGVGDLKKVLSNVKTRGVLGEVQLGAILEQILSPEQYEKNVVTKKGSRELVEFAIKLPGENNAPVWLPIDAKFPVDAYQQLVDAYETSDVSQVETALKQLKTRVKGFAKDIQSKYVAPPDTTDFAIMFLPIEGLYAELVRSGMIETLQNDYRICLAGPTTMGALLNSIQMGFKTIAIQKRSNEVWQVLSAVKSEFETFASVLDKTQKKINEANDELDKLVGVRTRQIQRKLGKLQGLPIEEAESVLLLNDIDV